MRYLVTMKLNDGTFIHLLPEFSQAISSQWMSERSFNLSSTTNIRSWWVFPSPFNLNICTVNCTTETEGIFEKRRWNFHSFNTWIFSNNLFVVKEQSFKFSSKTNIHSRWVFPSAFNLDICTVRKGRIKSPCVSLECAIRI